jgi:hypothetical protein
MASTTCWKCKRLSHMTPHGQPMISGAEKVLDRDESRIRTFTTLSCLFTCDNCSHAVLGQHQWEGALDPKDFSKILLGQTKLTWHPAAGDAKDFPNVPRHIASAASEAYECLSIGARRSAVQMARSVVEATAKHLGITSGPLIAKIDTMKETGHIRAVVADGAHGVRGFGNDMAHGDFVQPVEQEDAELVLTLMSALLDEVFQLPAQVAQAQQRVSERRAAQAPEPTAP